MKAFYDLPTSSGTRSTGFGYGKRSDFTLEYTGDSYLDHKTSPGSYKIKSIFEKSTSTGFSFGMTRRSTKNGRNKESYSPKKTPPGPGSYSNNHKAIGTEGKRWTLRPRTISPCPWERTNVEVPGPGAYDPKLDLSENGISFVSKYESTKVARFSPPSFKRFSSKPREMPGPGEYDPKTHMTRDGNYFISNYRSSNACKFSKSSRKFFGEHGHKNPRNSTPGPGEYVTYSDFGGCPPQDTKMNSLSVRSATERKHRGDDTNTRSPSPI
jgi:hypothetical protein